MGIRNWDEIRGRVLYVDSKKPVEDATLIYHWEGTSSSFVASRDQCYHMESAISNADGVFVVPAWKESLGNRQHRILDPKWYLLAVAYKPGYRVTEQTLMLPAQQPHLVYLEKYEPVSREAQLWSLLDVIRKSDCGNSEGMEKLKPTYLSICRQADQLAVTDQERKIVDEIKYTIVTILGYSEYPSKEEAINSFFGDHTERLSQ